MLSRNFQNVVRSWRNLLLKKQYLYRIRVFQISSTLKVYVSMAWISYCQFFIFLSLRFSLLIRWGTQKDLSAQLKLWEINLILNVFKLCLLKNHFTVFTGASNLFFIILSILRFLYLNRAYFTWKFYTCELLLMVSQTLSLYSRSSLEISFSIKKEKFRWKTLVIFQLGYLEKNINISTLSFGS